MRRTYEEIVTERRVRLPPESAAQREAFEKAYDIALQVIALRERHGVTHAQLAARCGIDQGDISRMERGSSPCAPARTGRTRCQRQVTCS